MSDRAAERLLTSWWGRPCGGREVLQLAMPLVLSSLSWTLLTFIDRMFLTWWSQDALGASFPAALLWSRQVNSVRFCEYLFL